MIRVLVADDHTMVREMLKISFARSPDFEVVAEAADGRELLDYSDRTRPDVALVDYDMPYARDFSGLIRRLRSRHPRTQVVVLSGTASEGIAQRAARGGARGYVVKSTRLGAVSDAIRTVAAGGTWIDANLPRPVFDAFQALAEGTPTESSAPQHPGLATLTRREREVLTCVAAGANNRDIAAKLSLSEATVKAHLGRIFRKLAVKSRLEAALAFHGRKSDSARAT